MGQERGPQRSLPFLRGQKESIKSVSFKQYLIISEPPNFFFFQNLRREIDKVCAFLGKTLSEEQLQVLVKHLHFDNFSKNESLNMEFLKEEGFANSGGNFIRKGKPPRCKWNPNSSNCYQTKSAGKTGDWKNHFSSELNSRLDEWIEKNLEGTDLKFTMELDQQD